MKTDADLKRQALFETIVTALGVIVGLVVLFR